MPAAPSPWMNFDDLMKLYPNPPATMPSASYDANIQTLLNQDSSMQPPSPSPQTEDSSMQEAAPSGYGGASQRTRPADFGAINKLIGSLDAKNTEGYKLQKDEIDRLKAYRDQMPKGPEGVDLTGLMSLADAWGDGSGKVFTGAYKAPETAQERAAKASAIDQLLAKEGGTLTNEELAGLKDRLSGEIAKLHYGMIKDSMNSQKASDNEEKDANNLMKFLDTERTGGRMAPIAKAQGNLFQAQRLQALLDQYKEDPNKMPLTGPASLSEVAIGLNSLLSANGGSEESRKSLIPQSARGKYSTVEQFLANEPVGAEMGEFVKNAQDTLNREVQTNAKQVQGYKDRISKATGGSRLSKSNPERYKAIMSAYITPQDLANANAGGSTIRPPAVGDIVDGHKFLGGDPSNPSSWEKAK